VSDVTTTKNSLSWTAAEIADTWTLTNINTTRHEGAICIEDKAVGVGDAESPWVTLANVTQWRKTVTEGTRPEGSGHGLFFRFATDGAGAGATAWQGPYDNFDDLLGAMQVNLTTISARESVDDTLPYGQFRIRLYPA